MKSISRENARVLARAFRVRDAITRRCGASASPNAPHIGADWGTAWLYWLPHGLTRYAYMLVERAGIYLVLSDRDRDQFHFRKINGSEVARAWRKEISPWLAGRDQK